MTQNQKKQLATIRIKNAYLHSALDAGEGTMGSVGKDTRSNNPKACGINAQKSNPLAKNRNAVN